MRSPDAEPPANPSAARLHKEGEGYILRTDVEEVVLNATVLEGPHIVQDLKRDNFQVFEDGVKQNIISFQHTDLPVSIALVVDNSGSMSNKRPAVNKSALDLIEASNPQDEAFVVNFSDEAFIDQEFTCDVSKLRDGLSHIESRGGTALYDAVVASADKLVADAKRPKQVLVIITDGEDNASTLSLEQTIRRVQQLSGPVIYSIGLLFGDEMTHSEVRHARRALEMLSGETGGIAFFPNPSSRSTRSPPRSRATCAASTPSATTPPSPPATSASGASRSPRKRPEGASSKSAPAPAISPPRASPKKQKPPATRTRRKTPMTTCPPKRSER